MTVAKMRRGQCLCGCVSVAIPASKVEVGVCHCDTCRKWCSGPWMAIHSPEATVEGETLEVFRSSAFAERGFCARCGSAIFHRPQDGPELAVSAGLFKPDDFWLPDLQRPKACVLQHIGRNARDDFTPTCPSMGAEAAGASLAENCGPARLKRPGVVGPIASQERLILKRGFM